MTRVLPKVNSLTLTKENIDKLDTLIGQIPACYSLQLIALFQKINQEQNKTELEVLKNHTI